MQIPTEQKKKKLKLNLSNLHEPSLKNFYLPLMPRLVNDTYNESLLTEIYSESFYE